MAPLDSAQGLGSARGLSPGASGPLPFGEGLRAPARRGRGATHNPANRYDVRHEAAFDDGWATLDAEFAQLPPLPTTLTPDRSRSALSWNSSPDLGFDRAVNPYRGCEHGCVYCYARPSHAWLGYSPGLDFETRLTFKPEIASLLERELRRPGYVAKPVALGSNTDPYQPVERTQRLTRQVLEVLERFGHPVSIVTKSAGVLAAPMIPGLNDAELERILAEAARAGARTAGYVLLRLPGEVAELFEAWLHQHYPERARHVLALVRQTRAGALYDSRFGHRQRGGGAYADMLAARFARAARQHGLEERPSLARGHFAVPSAQLSLL